MCDVSPKIKCRDTLLRFKTGSPKLREALRKRCQERWKNNREEYVNKLRNLSRECDIQETLASFMKEDLRDLYKNYAAKEKTSVDENLTHLNEIKAEQELETDWFLNTYDGMLEDDNCLQEMFESINDVICPVCQKSLLNINKSEYSSSVFCNCGLNVETQLDLFAIREKILEYVGTHNNICDVDATFSVLNEPDGNHIYLICYNCSSLSMLF